MYTWRPMFVTFIAFEIVDLTGFQNSQILMIPDKSCRRVLLSRGTYLD